MKFTNGNWMLQPGIKAYYPAQVYDAEGISDSEATFSSGPIKARIERKSGWRRPPRKV